MNLALFAQTSTDGGGASGVVAGLIGAAIAIFTIAAIWKTFTKAGQPGWAAIVPIYNYVVLAQIGGYPGWYALLMLIPLVNIVIAIIVSIGGAKAFGKGGGFGVLLAFLAPIGYGILGFGDVRYQGAPRQA